MMRGEIFKHWQIAAATLFSVVLVGGAYLFARGIESPQVAQASTETALLQAIASKDSDSDGLPDWEESLYGTDPQKSDSFHLGMTDGEAVAKGLIVPKAIADISTTAGTSTTSNESSYTAAGLTPPKEGTLTASFARNFFTIFLAAKQANGGADLSESQMNDVANQTMNTLTASLQPTPDFKSMNDLAVLGSGPEALKTFAVNAEAVLLKNTNDATTTDLNYFKSAIMGGDKSAYEHITSIAKGYRDSAAGLAMLQVPQELAASDLLLINSLMRMSELDTDFTQADTDPLAAILALQQYQTVATSLQKAFTGIGTVYSSARLALPAGAPGALFVNMISDIKREQKATTKP